MRKKKTCPFEKCFLAYRSMFVYQKICLSRKLQLSHTVGAAVAEARLRAIENLATAIAQPLAQIDIFEPNGKELLIEAADCCPTLYE